MNNPFQSPAFSMTALTAAINILPNQFGKLDQLNLMPARPVRFRQIGTVASSASSSKQCAFVGVFLPMLSPLAFYMATVHWRMTATD